MNRTTTTKILTSTKIGYQGTCWLARSSHWDDQWSAYISLKPMVFGEGLPFPHNIWGDMAFSYNGNKREGLCRFTLNRVSRDIKNLIPDDVTDCYY